MRASSSPDDAGGHAATTIAALGPLVAAVVCVLMLGGCPTVDLGDPPPDIGVCRPDLAYFKSDIWPKVLAPADEARSCVSAPGCHQAENGRSALRFDTSDPPDLDNNYAVATRFLNCGAPEASLLLTKPMQGPEPHGGGDLFNSDDPVIAEFLVWFDQ